MSKILNVEIKARCLDPFTMRSILKNNGADFKGIDHQVDTYFNCDKGRLKLRNGKIENSLIFYKRDNQEGPKESNVSLTKLKEDHDLEETLKNALGVLVEVDKKREIYFIGNVKFHLDQVKDLGSFVEIEAIDTDGSISKSELRHQCEKYMKLLQIKEKDLIQNSYSDIILEN